jgi:hypothetical protein
MAIDPRQVQTSGQSRTNKSRNLPHIHLCNERNKLPEKHLRQTLFAVIIAEAAGWLTDRFTGKRTGITRAK